MAKKSLVFLLLALPSFCFAAFESGRYEVFDRYGLPPSPDFNDSRVKKFTEFHQQAVKGGTLRTHTSENMDLIFPGLFQKGIQRQVVSWDWDFYFIYEPLMREDVRGLKRTLYPALAKAVRVDAKQGSYVIELREGVTFSDGSPMTAQDLIQSWEFEISEAAGPATLPAYERLYGKKVELKELTPFEVEVRFPDIAPVKQREALWNFLKLNISKKNSTSNPSIEIPYPVIGTGPYTFVSAARNRVVLRKRADYWDQDSPLFNFDQIETIQIRDRSVAREAFKKGVINFFEEFNSQHESILDGDVIANKMYFTKSEILKSDEEVLTHVLHMNMSRPHMNDFRFREAVALAFDLETANQNFYNGKITALETPGGNSPLSPKGLPSPETLVLMKDDPQFEEAQKPFEKIGFSYVEQFPNGSQNRERLRKATQLLKDAGYEVIDQRLTKNGAPVELALLIWLDSRIVKAALVLQKNLQRLGIQLVLRTFMDSTAMLNDLKQNRYDIFPQPIPIPRNFDVLDPDDMYQRFSSTFAVAKNPHNLANNLSNWISPAIDNLLEKFTETDPATPEYKNMVDAFLRLASANVPFLLAGERTDRTYYMDKRLCLPPISNSRILESAYFSDKCYRADPAALHKSELAHPRP